MGKIIRLDTQTDKVECKSRGLRSMLVRGYTETSLDALDRINLGGRYFEVSPFKQIKGDERCAIIVPGRPFTEAFVCRNKGGNVLTYVDGFENPVMESILNGIIEHLGIKKYPLSFADITTFESGFQRTMERYSSLVDIATHYPLRMLDIYGMVQFAHFLIGHKGVHPEDAMRESLRFYSPFYDKDLAERVLGKS